MKELSLHILDIVENGISAGADLITLSINEDKEKNLLEIIVSDNGKGIPEHMLHKVIDPFFTEKPNRRVGLGLSLFREASKRCGGEFKIRSKEGKGTEIYASFKLDNIDLAPIGDLEGSLISLIIGNSEVDFLYSHKVDIKEFTIDTRIIKNDLEGLSVSDPSVIPYIVDFIRLSFKEM